MYRIAWITALLLVPTALAGEWDKLSNDLELFEQVIGSDEGDINQQQRDAVVEDSPELFPVLEGEEEEVEEVEDEAEFATITVDGVEVELKDVPLEEWFAQYIVDAAQMNLVSGYADAEGNPTGEFGPADFVTIEQLAKMAVIAAGIDLYNCGDSLKNSSARGRWSQKYVQCAEYNRWIIFSDGIVDPSRPADRAEVVVTVIQAFSARVSPVSGTVFEDVTRATPYGNAVETAAGDGVVSGYSGSNGNPTGYFGPGDPVNRAETAKIFSLASQTYGKR